jgi:Chaperone of endosialidase
MTTKSVLFGARRGTGLGARGVAGLSKSVESGNLNLNKAGTRMPVSIPLGRNSIGRPPLRRGFLLVPFAILLAWFALSPARAVTPAPDGAYPGANTAEGTDALFSLTTGRANTAIGFDALFRNATGNNNTATGVDGLFSNTTGSANTAIGSDALFRNATGNNNTATGVDGLFSNTTGSANTAAGFNALLNNTTGNNNIAMGVAAGQNLTTGNNNIDIGNLGIAGESNKIRIGTVGVQQATFIAGIRGTIVPGGVGVIVGLNGQLGTVSSSGRFKEAIKPMDQASEAILALKPVTFRYKHELDPAGIPQFGLVAEQVAKVNPDLVARDDQGKVNTVRYEAVNAMLLNEFLKEHRKVRELEAALAQQQKDFAQQFARQQKEIKALAASLKQQGLQIQKVSGQLGVSKPALQTAAGG